MVKPLALVKGSLSYLRSNPAFLVKAAVNAARMKVAIPIDALRWMVDQRPKNGKGPERLDLVANGQDLGISATVDVFGTKISSSSSLRIDSVSAAPDSLRIELRVLDLKVDAPAGSPAAMMLGSMDLKRPGNLMGFMPKKPAALVDARDDRFVLDLMLIPKLAANKMLRRVLSLVSDVVGVKDVRVENDMLVISFSVNPRGVPLALARLRAPATA
jgi:hypothetical protein